MINNQNILELQINNRNAYIISLLSTLKLPHKNNKLDNKLYQTQISTHQLDQAVLNYIELIKQIKSGVFQAQIQEDIVKLITEQSYNLFYLWKKKNQTLYRIIQNLIN
ncbi:unnamed protein product [Paramecium sonneborni]|uniref:Uncharacterized protein n=1 Tax=Paramecium sonneborni TaxID=65129 RepID=A0A8S1KPP1_9CILI|nr:unnamed protein product [Paramecium sonneborni]